MVLPVNEKSGVRLVDAHEWKTTDNRWTESRKPNGRAQKPEKPANFAVVLGGPSSNFEEGRRVLEGRTSRRGGTVKRLARRTRQGK